MLHEDVGVDYWLLMLALLHMLLLFGKQLFDDVLEHQLEHGVAEHPLNQLRLAPALGRLLHQLSHMVYVRIGHYLYCYILYPL